MQWLELDKFFFHVECNTSFVLCRGGGNIIMCVPSIALCNGTEECINHYDERACSNTNGIAM